MRKLSIFLFVILLCCILSFAYVSAAQDMNLDDRDEIIHYSSFSSLYGGVGAFNGSLTRLGPGASGTFKFSGTAIDLYFARFRNSGYVAIWIDNEYMGTFDTGRVSDGYSYGHKVYSVSDLDDTEHTVMFVSTGDTVKDAYSGNNVSGYLFFDGAYISARCYDSTILYTVLIVFVLVLLFVFLVSFSGVLR